MSGAAAAAAAAHQAKLREEEEALTTYNNNDLDGWEFKIVRSNLKIKGEAFAQLLEEEKQNGWELVEKFDDTRIRFKRRIERREQDKYAELDPYRSHVGMSDSKLVFLILGGVAVFTLAIVYIAVIFG